MGKRTKLTLESFRDHLRPIVSPAVIPAPARVWSSDDWARLILGHRAEEMEDKWLAFVDHNRLFLHRSWTGVGIYEARYEEGKGGWSIVEALVESDPTTYQRSTDEAETLCLELTIESVLLDRFHEHGWKRWAELVGAADEDGARFGLLLHAVIGNQWGHPLSNDHRD